MVKTEAASATAQGSTRSDPVICGVQPKTARRKGSSCAGPEDAITVPIHDHDGPARCTSRVTPTAEE